MPTLSTSQLLFESLVSQYPVIAKLFNFVTLEYDPKAVEEYFNYASSGETVMARFFLAVWSGRDSHRFDFVEAAQVLDGGNMLVIINWLKNPFWP